jgi:osmoprotectant transport system permease protein
VTEAGFFSQVVEWFTDPANWSGPAGVPARLLEHLRIASISVGIASLVALPVGMDIGHRRRFEFLVVSVANIGRAIPSFGLLLLFVIIFGLGDVPIVAVMVLLAIPPILINTYVGIQAVDPDTVEAARGMGMSDLGVLGRIELPLAGGVILAGLRIATVQIVANATVAAVAAGGGLGRFIVDGFSSGDRPQVFAGAVLVAVLAIATEVAFEVLQRAAAPRTSSRERRYPGPEALPVPPVLGPAA